MIATWELHNPATLRPSTFSTIMARLLYRALLARYMNIIQKVYIWWRIVAFLGVKLYHWMAYPFKSHASKYHNYEFGRQDPPLYIPRTNHCSVGTSPLSLLLWNYNYRHYQPAKSSGFALMQLPLEIRLMIWKFCIGGKTLHLMSRKNKHLSYRHLTHIACKEHMNFNGDSCRMLCRNYLRQLAFPEDLHCRRDFWVREFKIYGPGLLHLPMTCRQMCLPSNCLHGTLLTPAVIANRLRFYTPTICSWYNNHI